MQQIFLLYEWPNIIMRMFLLYLLAFYLYYVIVGDGFLVIHIFSLLDLLFR